MRLIDADALKQTFCAKCACVGCENCNINFHFEHLAPTIDAEPVKHGHLVEAKYPLFTCSECGATYQDTGYGYNYCPNCGAKMDEGGNKYGTINRCGRVKT